MQGGLLFSVSTVLLKWSGNFPGVQWLRFCASNAGGAGSIPGRGTKIPHTAQSGQNNKGHFIFCHPELFNILEIIIWLCDKLGRGSGILQNPSPFIPVAGKARRGYIYPRKYNAFIFAQAVYVLWKVKETDNEERGIKERSTWGDLAAQWKWWGLY